MGSSQSIPSTSEITDTPLNVSNVKEYTASTKNGPKSKTMDQTNPISVTIEEESIDDDASIVSTESDYSSDEEEADEYLAERRKILEEARQLREVAEYYYHPEAPVASSMGAQTRCFFSRYSAPVADDEEQREQILADAKNLKEVAEWYLSPEKPVASSDATAFGRNYFTRPSAPEQEDEEERERILEEMKQLKTVAEWYMCPEKPVAVDATACGRNYFSRPSAPVNEEEEERELILEEMKQLKTTAEWYMCPEKPVAVDSTACGRDFFARPSAEEYEDDEEVDLEERDRILEEMKQLKTTAEWYMCPEKPVAVDSTSFGRNYFSRPSAPLNEEEEEREQILAEMKELKMTADWYMHPEKPVAVDSTACGRNFFSRPSAFDDNAGAVAWEGSSEGQKLSLDFESNYTEEMEEERTLILAEMNQLKEVANWYMHPEKPVAVDSTSFGRNYFSRASAPEQEDVEDIEERELILAEVNELRMVAEWYQHPEKEVTVYATATGRNYFSRPSAPVEEDSEEREQILADAAELLRVAQWYMHPEEPVTVYATACGRNYFSRPSTPEEEEMEEERERILEEMKQLKATAEWYMHPEKPVAVDATACGRNYFSRPSAPEYEEDSEERDQVLADAKDLKEVAGWYSNPEQPVKSDGFASARSYFSRPSAPEQEDDDDDRMQVIAEAKELKEVASWYLQPEKAIAVDSTSFGRNYFTRPSAPEQEDDDDEQVQIIAEAKELKKLAVDYLHPEKPVERSSVNCARNYFDRASATGHADHIHTEGFVNDSKLHGDYVQHGWDHHAAYDHHYDQHDLHHHDCDVSQQSLHSHGDHFDMDEDLSGFREGFTTFHDKVVGVHDPEHIPVIKEEDGGKEGNLSRSPSSIMLFDEQAAV